MPTSWPSPRTRSARGDQTQRLRRYWDKHARDYDRQMAFWERRLFGDGRAWVCAQASGQVLEVAIGTGRNLALYPPDVRLTGVDFSHQMLQQAQRRADQLGRQVDLRLGDAQALDFPDASFDTVVCTLSLCAIPDQRRAIAEMWRVLRQAASCCCWTTWPPRHGPHGRSNGCWSGLPSRWAANTCGAGRCCRCRPKGSRSNAESGPSSGSWSG